MSYNLDNHCWKCVNEKTCIDRPKLQEAIDNIFRTGRENGHLGAGTVLLHCQMIDTCKTVDSERK